ncbi:MAG: hypothetical protein IKX31_12325 [Muribaculaceae bacterium]|nr:hypothetical protein [Muribaculaceae bacterium]
MKKYLLGLLILVIAEIAAIAFSWYLETEVINGYDDVNVISSSYVVHDLSDSIDSETGKPVVYSCLVFRPAEKVVRKEVKKHNYDYEMQIYDENNGYALVKMGKMWNVYGREGEQIFKKDRIYNYEFDKMPQFVGNDLIADYSTGEYFDLKGNPVSSMKTTFDYLKNKNPFIFNMILFFVIPVIVYFLWYFLFWKRLKRKHTLSKVVRATHSILVLLLSLGVALFAAFIITEPLFMHYAIGNSMNYKLVDGEDENGSVKNNKLVWYNSATDSNEVVRESSSGMEEGSFSADNYIIIIDDSKSNVYGPEGKAVFAEDLENANLMFNRDGDIIMNCNTGDCYDVKGNLVDNMKTAIYKNESAVMIGCVVVFWLVAFVLWFFLSWRRRKKD